MAERATTRWVTVAEAAKRLSLSASGVRKLISRGQIPCAHLGRSLRVDWPRLEAQLEREILKFEEAGGPQ